MIEDIDKINNSLFLALVTAQQLQQKVFEAEGESDLFKKLSNYTIPNLQHWLNGAQAGSVKDLNDVLVARNAPVVEETKKKKKK